MPCRAAQRYAMPRRAMTFSTLHHSPLQCSEVRLVAVRRGAPLQAFSMARMLCSAWCVRSLGEACEGGVARSSALRCSAQGGAPARAYRCPSGTLNVSGLRSGQRPAVNIFGARGDRTLAKSTRVCGACYRARQVCTPTRVHSLVAVLPNEAAFTSFGNPPTR